MSFSVACWFTESDDRAKSPLWVENLATDTAWCCDLKMNTAALAIEHLAHRDVVCIYSRLKG
jgi:hypothetical protein